MNLHLPPKSRNRLQPKIDFSAKFLPIFSFGYVTPKGTSAGRNSSCGAITVSVSAVVPEKSRGNKKFDEGEEEAEPVA